jgi:hypothetical protein
MSDAEVTDLLSPAERSTPEAPTPASATVADVS